MRKFTAGIISLMCITSVANAADGGQLDMPVSVNFTAADKCLPNTFAQQYMQLSADEVGQVGSLSGYSAPSVKIGNATLSLENCPVDTILSITAGGTYTVAKNMQPINNAGAAVTAFKLNDVPQWGFDGAAADKLGMTVFMPKVSDDGYLQEIGAPGSTTSETKLTTANEVQLTYSINAIDKAGAQQMASGDYSTTATLIIAIK